MNFLVSLKGPQLSKNEAFLLEKPNVLGVVLYGKNILSVNTTLKLIKQIKGVKKGLKICVDEEGGLVSRFSHLFPSYSQPYCTTINIRKAKEHYKKRAGFLKTMGIDINFAPVVDISSDEMSFMYKRSYGADIEKIIELSRICVQEQSEAEISSCIKHFPGHGRTKIDSHQETPIINVSLEEWGKNEGKIFQALINLNIEYIMVSHLLYPKVDNKIAPTSDFWIKHILQDKLGFKGKVVIDDICMRGASCYSDKISHIKGDLCIVTNQKLIP